jgi:CHAT domain-containing protein
MPAQRVVLAEYFTVEDRTLLFIVREDFEQPLVKEILIGTETIQNFVKNYFQEKKVKDWNEQDEQDYQDYFCAFVAPLVYESPKGDLMTQENDIIWLVPHNFLHYLPLHALKVGDRYLIERNPVCYTPSASVMKYCHEKRKGRREKALILADSRLDRLHTQEQGLAIQAIFHPHAELYIGSDATKNLLQQKLRNSKDDIDILHIACHGEFNAFESLKSCIKLAKTKDQSAPEGEDELTAAEIFSLEMKADLVILSACESGINDNKPGDELIGLTRSLICAGTPSVVVSLWEVEEISTSILMSRFYQKLKDGSDNGVNKAEALQTAQLEVKKMTAQDVINYCIEAKKRLDSYQNHINNREAQILLDIDIVKVRLKALDLEGAKRDAEKLIKELQPNSKIHEKLRQELRQIISTCNRGLRSPNRQRIKYEQLIYNNIFHWAAFILVGDWR